MQIDSAAKLMLADGATITQGGITLGASSILDVESTHGATLDGVTVTGNSSIFPSAIEIGAITDGGSTLTVKDGTYISYGEMTIGGASTLDVESESGATLDGVFVIGTSGEAPSTIEIGVHSEGGSILTVKNDTYISNGNMTIAADSVLDVEGAGGATLDGVTVTGTNGDAPSTIEIGVNTEGGSILTLLNGTYVSSDNMTIAANSILDIESAGGATLDGVTVSGTNGDAPSTIEIGFHTISGSILTLLDGTSITYGDMTIAAKSTLDIESAGGATLNDVVVTNAGTIRVDGEATTTTVKLVLEGGTTIAGGNLLIHDLLSPDEGVVEIETGGATFGDLTVTNNNELIIDATVTLTLTDNTSILGGTIHDDGTLLVSSASEIENATIDGGGDVTVTGGTLMLSGVTLNDVTLSGSFTNADALTLDTVTLSGATLSGGTDAATGVTVSADSEIENATVTGDITVDTGKTLTLNTVTLDGVTLSGGTDAATGVTVSADSEIENATVTGDVTVDTGKTLTLNTVTLDGVTLSGGTDAATGVIVSADSEIENATVTGDITVDTGKMLTLDTVTLDRVTLSGGTDAATGVTVSANSEIENATITGGITVDTGRTLTLNTVTLDGVTLSGGTDAATGVTVSANSEIENATVTGDITVDAGKTLTLNTVTLAGGTLSGGTDAATGVIVSADSEIENATVTGDITVDAGKTLTLDTVTLNGATLNGGTIADIGTLSVMASSEIENATVSGGGSITVGSGKALTLATDTLDNVTLAGSFSDVGTVTIDETVTLNGATLSGGTIDDTGTLKVTASSEIKNATVDGGGNVTVTAGTLTLSGVTLDDLTLSGSFTDADTLTINDTVTLSGGTISGGTIAISGILDSTATSFITGSTIVNPGHINVASGTLTIDPAPFTNTGTIEVDSTASLVLSGETVTNSVTVGATTTNGTIQVDPQGLLKLNGSTINGGIVDTLGTIDVTAASSINNTLSFINSGTVDADGAALTLFGATISNAGGTLESTGSGLLKLVNTTINSGTLGGKIATAIGNTSSTLNGITLEATSLVTAAVGVLELTGFITNNGEFDASTGATLGLDNATVKGGTLGGSGTIVTAASSFDTLNGVTIAHGSTVTVADGTTLELVGTITDSGTIALGSSGHATQLEISGSVSLAGGGNVTMTDKADNSIVSDGSSATLTNSDTISGAGTIGDSHLTLINNGTVDATGTHPLIINTGVTNNHGGVLEASAGATLDVNGNVVNDGLIEAGSSASVTITGNVTNSTGSTGAIDIFAHAKVEITGTVSSGQTVIFEQSNGAGLLILDDSHDFKGTITGLVEADPENAENHVDLTDLAWHNTSFDGHQFQTMHVSFDAKDSEVIVSYQVNFQTIDSVTLKVSGISTGEFEISSDGHGGTLLDDPSATGNVSIDSDQMLGISAASSATVNFTNSTGTTGELLLVDSKDFTGTIAGFAGDGTIANSDLIDIADVNFADIATSKTTYTENADGTGTLNLYNANGQAIDSLNFTGNYQLANFTIENDGSGGTLIVDPPVNTSSQTTASAVVASGADQVLSGSAPAENFVFNFAALGHSAIANFNPAADMIQFSSSVFANIQSILNAVHDDGHGNSVISIDAHDSITLNGVNKAQLHASDFHVV